MELRALGAVAWIVQRAFTAADLARGLHRLKEKQVAEERPQLHAVEVDAAVSLAIALADRVRAHGEVVPDVIVPTSRGTLRKPAECVFNNMKWLGSSSSAEEQQKRNMVVTNRGLDWVHPSVSNEVAQALGVLGLNAQIAAEAMSSAGDGAEDGSSWFEASGQAEPLTTRLRLLLRDITDGASPSDLSLFKELVQNADDAQATEVHFVWDWRRFGTQSLMSPEMARWQGPCLWAHNNACFSKQDFENITQLGALQKASGRAGGSRAAQIGRFGLGFNSVYSFTDLPSILSDDVVLFLDPHVRHLRAMGASLQKPGTKLWFLKIDVLDKFRDQFEPYHGFLGCDLTSSMPYQGTLIRLPFRTQEAAANSEISSFIASPQQALETLNAFRVAASECLIFLQNVTRIRFSWVPQMQTVHLNRTPWLMCGLQNQAVV